MCILHRGRRLTDSFVHSRHLFCPRSLSSRVQSVEPFFSVLLSAVFLGTKPELKVVLSLLPIVAGVSLASFTEASFNWAGFGAAMGSNVTFQSRNVLSKKLMGNQKEVPSTSTSHTTPLSLSVCVCVCMITVCWTSSRACSMQYVCLVTCTDNNCSLECRCDRCVCYRNSTISISSLLSPSCPSCS